MLQGHFYLACGQLKFLYDAWLTETSLVCALFFNYNKPDSLKFSEYMNSLWDLEHLLCCFIQALL
jgi:hypothetical protein